MGAFPNLSRNVPFCPRLSSFVLLGARNRDKSGQKSTNGDKTGHFGTNWETPPCSIYPHLALLKKKREKQYFCFLGEKEDLRETMEKDKSRQDRLDFTGHFPITLVNLKILPKLTVQKLDV